MAENYPDGRRPKADRDSRQAGFSLIEVLIGMAIIGILTGIGITAMPRDRLQAREAARVVAADLNRARTEAIRLNTNVAIDFGNADCARYCIYTDYTRSGSPDGDLDGDPSVIELSSPKLLDRDFAADFPRVAVAQADFGSTARVWFDVRGLPRASTGAYFATTGTIILRPANGNSGYRITLEPQGRVQVTAE